MEGEGLVLRFNRLQNIEERDPLRNDQERPAVTHARLGLD